MPGVPPKLFAVYDIHAQEGGTTTVNEKGAISATEPVQRLHNHNLSQNPDTNFVGICSVTIVDSYKNFTYPYTFITNDEFLELLGDIFTSGLSAWDFQYMLPTTAWWTSGKVKPPGPQTFADEFLRIENPQSGVESGRSKMGFSQSQFIKQRSLQMMLL